MSPKTVRYLGLTVGLGGLLQGLFFALQPGHSLAGAELAQTEQWFVAHSLHFFGASLTVIGLAGVHARQRKAAGGYGTFAFAAVMLGTAMNVATGLLSAYVWPLICANKPDMCAVDGALFDMHENFAIAFSLAVVSVILGWILYGIATIRSKVLPAPAGWAMVIGAIGFAMMPPPMSHLPFFISQTGGVVMSIGISWAGFAVWTGLGEPDDK